MDGAQSNRYRNMTEEHEPGWRDDEAGLRYIFHAALRQFHILLIVPISFVILSFLFAATIDPVYESSAKIRVNLDPDEALSSTVTPYKTHVELIQSESVTERVINMLGLEPPSEGYSSALRGAIKDIRSQLNIGSGDGDAEFNPDIALKRSVAAGLEVYHLEETSIIDIRYLSLSADFSAEAANAYARAYLEQNLDNSRGSLERRRQRLEERAEEVRHQSLIATQTAQEILSDSGFAVVSTDELGQRIASFREQLSDLNAETAVLKSRLARIPEDLEDGSLEQIATIDPEIQEIYAELKEAQGFLTTSEQTGNAQREAIAPLEQRINRIRSNLAAAVDRYRSELTTQISDLSERQESLLSERERLITYSQSDAWPELVNAERKAETYESIYQDYIQGLENMNRESVSSPVSIVSEARPPSSPSSPNYKVIIAFGLTIGIALAGGIALYREWRK